MSSDPVVRQQIARAVSGLRIMEWTNARTLEQLMRTGDLGSWPSLAKLQWATWHRDTTADLVNTLGPEAIVYETAGVPSGFPAYFLNARAETIYGGTNEIQKTILADRTLGLPQEPSAL